jgi:Fic family protein
VFGTFTRQTWLHDPTAYAPAKYRRACAYDAFIPDLLANLELSLSGSVAGIIADAESSIHTLNEHAYPGLAPLARLLLRTESIASSKVEGMQVDGRALARAEVRSDTGQKASVAALEILANIDAMQTAIENATEQQQIDLPQIVEIHRILMADSDRPGIAGQIRTQQNWIGGNNYNPCGADFVPPPPEEVEPLLEDLCTFCNSGMLPALAQAALAHAQFETIHPHEDGNGRTGRALVQVILKRRNIAPHFVPPISVVLAQDKEGYIDGLVAYREGNFERWLEVFAAAATRAAQLASRYLTQVRGLQDLWRSQLVEAGSVRKDAAAWQLIDMLPGHPVITVPVGVAKVNRSKPAVNGGVKQLVNAGVLRPLTEHRRNRAWEATRLFHLRARRAAGERPEDDEVGEGTNPPTVIPRVRPTTGGEQTVAQLPWTDDLFVRLGPGSWLIPPADAPEVTLRVAVALPNVLFGIGAHSTGQATLIRGQKREDRLIALLESSPITEQLHRLDRVWGGARVANWEAVGTGALEFSELWFAPYGLDAQRPPLTARCGVTTGWVDNGDGTQIATIQAALDIMINLTELNEGRRPDTVAHRTDNPPAPAALSLDELADILHGLLVFPDVIVPAARSLIPDPQLTRLKLAEWVTFSGFPSNRLIDLRSFRLLARSSGLGQIVGGVQVEPYQLNGVWTSSWSFIADMLYEALEQGGYRDIDSAIETIREQSCPAALGLG